MSFEAMRMYGIIGYPLYEKAFFSRDYIHYETVFIISAIVAAIAAYLIGSLNFALIISKLKYKDDIRKYGSGNAGMTNMMRTYGRAAGIFTFLGDILKGVFAVIIATLLMGEACGYIAGIGCILGHCYPVWYKFKGGKGVAVTAAMILCLEPLVFVMVLLIFIVCVAFTKYISLGSMMAALVYPLFLQSFYRVTHTVPNHFYIVISVCSIVITLLLLFMHRSNMKRLLDGKENKFSFKKKGTNSPVIEPTTESQTEKKRSMHHEDDED